MIRQLYYIDHNHITLLATLLCMVNTPESLHCRPVPVCHIRLPHFAAAIKCRNLVPGIGYSTVPHFGPLGRFWYSSLTPSNCDLSHRRSVAVLCMLYKIRCNPKHPLCGALPVPYVPVQVTRGALITHRYTFRLPAAEPRSTAGLLFPSQSLSGMVWLTPYLMVWDWRVSNAFLLA